MTNHDFTNWSNFSKTVTAPLAELNKLYSNTMEQFSKSYMNMATESVSEAIKHAQSSVKAKDAEEWMRLQMGYMADATNKLTENGVEIYKTIEHASKNLMKMSEDFAKKANGSKDKE